MNKKIFLLIFLLITLVSITKAKEEEPSNDPNSKYKEIGRYLIDDFSGWVDGHNKHVQTSKCGDDTVLAGANVNISQKLVQRQFTFDTAYTDFKIEFNLYAIDSWDFESLNLYVNDVQVYQNSYNFQASKIQICGSKQFKDRILKDQVGFASLKCTTKTITIKFMATLDQTASDESFGISKLRIYGYNRCSEGCQCCLNDKLESNARLQNNCLKCHQDQPASSTCTEIQGHHIEDLVTTFKGWRDERRRLIRQYHCADTVLLNGFQSSGKRFAQKSFELKSYYNKIFLEVYVFLIDSWDNELFQVFINNELAYERSHQFRLSKGNICGNPKWADYNQYVQFEYDSDVPFNQIDVKFTSTLNQPQNDESWGVRDLKITAYNICPKGCEQCARIGDKYECYLCQDEDLSCTEIDPVITDATEETGFEGWVGDENVKINTTNCTDITILNGFNGDLNQASKTFKLDTSYFKFLIVFQAYFVDSWDGEDLKLIVNGKELFSTPYVFDRKKANICGAKVWPDNVREIMVKLNSPQSLDELNIKFSSTLDQNSKDESFGFRNLRIYALDKCIEGCHSCLKINDEPSCARCKADSTTCKQEIQTTQDLVTSFDGWYDAFTKEVVSPTSCGNEKILGGYGKTGKQFVTKTFNFDELFSDVEIWVTFYAIDTWDYEQFSVTVNGRAITQKTVWVGNSKDHLCGAKSPDSKFYLHGKIHLRDQARKFKVVVFSNLDEGNMNESWGIRDFKIFNWNICGKECNSPSNPKCTQFGTCSQCQNNDNCKFLEDTPVCSYNRLDPSTQTHSMCIGCIKNRHCQDLSKSKCNNEKNMCEVCKQHSDCTQFAENPFCKEGVGCQGCLSNTDCKLQSKSRCDENSGACESCSTNDHCKHLSSSRICNKQERQCVQCLSNEDCFVFQYCHSTKHVCLTHSHKGDDTNKKGDDKSGSTLHIVFGVIGFVVVLGCGCVFKRRCFGPSTDESKARGARKYQKHDDEGIEM